MISVEKATSSKTEENIQRTSKTDPDDKISRVTGDPIIPIAEYRKILDDIETPDEKIVERLQYLESLCRNIIRIELEKYVHTDQR